MGEIYVGSRNVTAQFATHFNDTPGVSLDGSLASTPQEVQVYTAALTYLEGQLSRANPGQREVIHQRFDGYRSLVDNGCDSRDRSTPYIDLLSGLYDELTSFIESSAFDRLPPAQQRRLVGLQGEVFSRLTQSGAPRDVRGNGGAATAAEAPNIDPYHADPALLSRVDDLIRNQVLRFEDQCGVNLGNIEEDEGEELPVFHRSVGRVSQSQPQPFNNRDVNTDFRYGIHEVPRPNQPGRENVEDQRPANPALNVDSNDPFGGDDIF